MMHQKMYAMEVLKWFNMLISNSIATIFGLVLEIKGIDEQVDKIEYMKIVRNWWTNWWNWI